MFDAATLVTFALTAIVVVLVPGPNVSITIAAGLTRGPIAALAIVAGTLIGVFTMMLVVALGFDALVGFMGRAFEWIKLIGALYLIYLGVGMFRSSGNLAQGSITKRETCVQLAFRGFVVFWSNPKALLFFSAFMPQFVTLEQPAFPQMMVLGGIFMAAVAISDSMYALLAGGAGRLVSRNRVRLMSRLSGLVLMAGGIWLATQQKS